MLKKVLAAIEKNNMLETGATVTVALSGGADSVALLYCLLELQKERSFNLNAAHLNHMLRGEESLRDENFVKELCDKLNIQLFCESIDVAAEAQKSGESIELAARKIRYDFLTRVSTGVIATAHTASDSFETMLFNLSRGTAINGLCGIPPKRDNLIRPLIYCTRADVEKYCSQNGIAYVTDSTNLTDDYTRNKIRHNVIPVLKGINPSAEQAVMRTALSLSEDADFLNGVARDALNDCVRDEKIDVKKLLSYHPAIAKRVVKSFYETRFSAILDSTAVNKAYDICKKGSGSVILPLKVKLTVSKGFLSLGESNFTKVKYEITYKIEKINNLLTNNCFDYDKISGSMVVRNRCEGDKIRLANRGVTKSLKKLFCELKIPEHLRGDLPVIADDKGVIWIYGVGISERVKIDSATENIVSILVEEIKE